MVPSVKKNSWDWGSTTTTALDTLAFALPNGSIAWRGALTRPGKGLQCRRPEGEGRLAGRGGGLEVDGTRTDTGCAGDCH